MSEEGRIKPLAAAPVDIAAPSLETVFRDHSRLVYRAAYRVTGNSADAEDVLQTVFLRLARRREAAVGSLESYLYRAAVNAALDLLRSRQASPGVSLEEVEPAALEDSSPSPERAFAAAELRLWLRATVARLSPLAAEIFVLRFFEGRDNGEIARLVGTTEGTVAVTLHRARERVFREFQAYQGGQS